MHDEERTIRPTNTCFDDALDWIVFRLAADAGALDKLVLAHGICLIPEGPEEGRPFAHAWVEEGEEAWDFGILNGEKVAYAQPKEQHAQNLRVQQATRYTVREAAHENQRSGHYGPWREEYAALCRDAKRGAA